MFIIITSCVPRTKQQATTGKGKPLISFLSVFAISHPKRGDYNYISVTDNVPDNSISLLHLINSQCNRNCISLNTKLTFPLVLLLSLDNSLFSMFIYGLYTIHFLVKQLSSYSAVNRTLSRGTCLILRKMFQDSFEYNILKQQLFK